ncbi:MAG TPA: SDR family oxidoreductase [Acidimicrobiales bacterium]
MTQNRILVTGATGFVGSRLVPKLLDRRLAVRCLVRTASKLDAVSWRDQVEVISGDIGGDLTSAMDGVDIAFYLVHSIGEGPDWAETEKYDARNFVRAAESGGVRRIVFLGGLGRDDDTLSLHLRTRHDVGRILASTTVEVVELRAGVIVGGGSASFEMLRKLVEVLPCMVTPKWVETRCQPIAITDMIELLVRAAISTELSPGVYCAGGPDILTYSEMITMFADAAGLPRRWLLKVPLLTPRLSSLWVGLVTPLPVPLARELVESLVNEVIVEGQSACQVLEVAPLGIRDAMDRAISATREVGTAMTEGPFDAFATLDTDPKWSGRTVLSDKRTATTTAAPAAVFAALERIGGANGWYGGGWLWFVRGLLDQLVGGPGLRRGRAPSLVEGESLDFWRVEGLDPPRRFRLRAEMRLPGQAWLTWDINTEGATTTVVQRADFHPRGFFGRVYWYAIAPFHRWVFPRMLDGIVASAESETLSSLIDKMR